MTATETNPNPIRKAAILVRTLDAESAAVLLAQLSPAEAKAVRAAVRRLGEVTDDEREQIAQEIGSRAATDSESERGDPGGVELELSGSDDPPPPSLPQPTPAEPTEPVAASPSAFPELDDVDAETMAAYLDRENSGVVAVVLSCLPPARAAAVLDELRFDQRVEALERLADLGEGDTESLHVVASSLVAWINARRAEQRRQADRLATIGAILEAAGSTCRDGVLSGLRRRGCDWLDAMQRAAKPTPPPRAIAAPPQRNESDETPETAAEQTAANQTAAKQPPEEPPPPSAPAPRLPFEMLERMTPPQLAAVVKRTPASQVLLALAGASESFQKRIESLIPARQAKQLRRRVESLGPTSLREVEAAQQAMTRVALGLAKQSQQPTVKNR